MGSTGTPVGNVYTLPYISLQWLQLGTLTCSQQGELFSMVINTQGSYNAAADFIEYTLLFGTSSASSYQTGMDGNPFYGAASCTVNGSGVDQNFLAVQQNSQTSYTFFVYMATYPGRGGHLECHHKFVRHLHLPRDLSVSFRLLDQTCACLACGTSGITGRAGHRPVWAYGQGRSHRSEWTHGQDGTHRSHFDCHRTHRSKFHGHRTHGCRCSLRHP